MRKTLTTTALAAVVSVLAVALAVNPFASAVVPGNNTRVSITGAGAQSTENSGASSMSRNGRFVAFSNPQNNFAGTDTGNDGDIFVRDLINNTVNRVSVSTSGVEANGVSSVPAISETGRYVVFGSFASNLIDGQTISSAFRQLYIRDTAGNTTTALTEVSAGTFANAHVFPIDVSVDGRFILLTTSATNMGPTVPSGYTNLYQIDRVAGTTTWVNAQGAGITYGYDTNELNAQMSCDGSFIVFNSSAAYLGLPSSSHVDVFLMDRRNGDRLTNITGSANGAALRARISCNGNYIGFSSYADNLDPMTAGMTLDYHAYRYDRINGGFLLLDQNTSGTIANKRIMNLSTDALHLSLSDNGKAVFASEATNLDAITSTGRQLFVRDPEAGTTGLLTRDSGGTVGNSDSQSAIMSLDGALVSYDSLATNLVASDTNAKRDIFVSETGF